MKAQRRNAAGAARTHKRFHGMAAIALAGVVWLASGAPAGASVVINEFMASNGSVVADEDGDYEDWIELYNDGSDPVNLEGYGLTDDEDEPFQWVFPDVTIGAGEYLFVWASGKDRKPSEGDNGDPDEPIAPDAIDGLAAWYDASAENGLADGDSMETWADQSGLGNHLTQPNGGDQPVFREDVINGLPAVAFDGTSQQFSFPHESFSGMETLRDFTFISLIRWNGEPTGGIWGTGPSLNNVGNVHFEIHSGGRLRLRVGDMNDINATGAVTEDGWHILAATQQSADGSPLAEVIRDGEVVGTRNQDPGEVTLSEFGGVFLGNSHDSQRNFGGVMAEVILYNGVLPAGERQGVENYLREKYEIEQAPGIPGPPIHTNFAISKDGEPLVLTDPGGNIVDALEPQFVPRDVSFGRYPDGGDEWGYLLEPTPFAENDTKPYTAPVDPPSFSHERGLYEAPFRLTLSHDDPEVDIYFTTDGSEPAQDGGERYTEPIPIETTETIRAIAVKEGALPERLVETNTYIFLDDVIQQPDDPEALGMPEAWGNWNIVHYGMNPEITQHAEYGARMREALTSIPTVSIVTDQDNLFDPDTGIYANPLNRGDDWERPASLELIYPDGEERGFQVDAGLRIQGGASRQLDKQPKKSFRVLFKSEYGPTRLEYPFFSEAGTDMDEFNTIIFRGEFNNEWLHWDSTQRSRGLYMRERFMRDSQIAMSGAGSHSNHVHLYINGLYWGLYNPSERPDAAFGETYFGGEQEDWDAITHAWPRRGDVRDGNTDAWQEMMALVDEGLESRENYEALQEYLDLPHYIDYMIVNLWAGMEDWPYNNWNTLRRREPGEGFMFFCWDSERAMEGLQRNRVGVNDDAARIYDQLRRENEEFRLLFADHVHRHLFNGGVLTPEKLIPRFIRTAAEVEAAVIAESARWGNYRRDKHSWRNGPYELYTHTDFWKPEYERLVNEYLPHRTDVVIEQFRSAGLYPEVDAAVFEPGRTTLLGDESLSMSASEGAIYYTIDGEDPRVPYSGDIAPGAIQYEDPITLAGGETVRARVLRDGEWSALNEAEFTEAPLEPHDLSQERYLFNEWEPASPAETYPPSMIFEQVQQDDPGLATEMDGFWTLPYNLTSRTRINGLGPDGISFVNTGNAQDEDGAGYLGSARLALNTLGMEDIHVQWTAGTVLPNDRVYGLRPQYRVGASGPFQDLRDENGNPLEYIRNETPGHAQPFGPVTLPSELEDEPYVELRWKYYHILGDSGPRAELRLNDIVVAAGEPEAATELTFDNQPNPTGQTGETLSPIIVRAVNEESLTDASFEGTVTISLNGGEGTLSGETAVAAEDGVAVFGDLSIINGGGTSTLTASASGVASAETHPFTIVHLEELLTPQYMQADVPNEDRVPYAFRLRLNGLDPNTQYRYANRIATVDEEPTQDGAGNNIFVDPANFRRNTATPDFGGDTGTFSTFETDSAGTYEGWFITEPTGNDRFDEDELHLRILLNDGAGGEDNHFILNTKNTAMLRRFGEEAHNATGIRGSSSFSPRNFVLLYDNVEGEGRPIAGTFVEPGGQDMDGRYTTFYEAEVWNQDGRWGTLLPNDLAEGVRRIEERDLTDGSVVGVLTSEDGLWDGVETRNPRGGATEPIVLALDDDSGNPAEPAFQLLDFTPRVGLTIGSTLVQAIVDGLTEDTQLQVGGATAPPMEISGDVLTARLPSLMPGEYSVRVLDNEAEVSDTHADPMVITDDPFEAGALDAMDSVEKLRQEPSGATLYAGPFPKEDGALRDLNFETEEGIRIHVPVAALPPDTGNAFLVVRSAEKLADVHDTDLERPEKTTPRTPAADIHVLVETRDGSFELSETFDAPARLAFPAPGDPLNRLFLGGMDTNLDERFEPIVPDEPALADYEAPLAFIDGEDYVEAEVRSFTTYLLLGSRVPGDVNNDGMVNAQDIQIVINAVLGLPLPEGVTEADTDVTGAGETNARDIQSVINKVLGIE
ncbi:MAG: chitobiase/beta-hexosaminidase C-terminal domain-containing protein [Candidatus Hydrogenedentota bacterium]